MLIGHGRSSEQVDADPSERLVRSELHAQVRDAVRRLPMRCRVVVQLTMFEDFTQAETATVLGIGIGAVEKQRSRAKRLLRQYLSETTDP